MIFFELMGTKLWHKLKNTESRLCFLFCFSTLSQYSSAVKRVPSFLWPDSRFFPQWLPYFPPIKKPRFKEGELCLCPFHPTKTTPP